MPYMLSIHDYTAALRENTLLGLKCRDCGAVTAPPRMCCRKCSGANLEILELSGRGRIVTFTSIYVPPAKFLGQTPYLVVIVELEEGPWIMGNLSGTDPGAASMELMDKKVKATKRPPPADKVDPHRVTGPEDGAVPLFELEGP